jgi:large conductance mechanosensitive channel
MAYQRVGGGLRVGARQAVAVLGEFRTFLLRGNVVDLAIGVVIGLAFSAVVTALVKDIITPFIAAIGAQPNFGGLSFTVNNSRILYGDFINALLSFLIIATVIFYFFVLPMNRLVAFSQRNRPAPAVTTRDCPECLSKIPLKARRCAFCASEVPPADTAVTS